MTEAANRAVIDEKDLTIDIMKGQSLQYQIDLEKCTTSAGVLDSLIQVAEKRWVSDELLGQVVRLLDKALRPQQNLCGCGHEKGPIDVSTIVKKNLTPN